MKAMSLVGAVLLACHTTASTGMAQRIQLGVTGASVRVLPDGDAAGTYTGAVGGFDARLAVGPITLDVWYLQGGLTPDGNAPPRDLVEGAIAIGGSPVPWVSIAFGPHGRSYLTPVGTQRWVFWEGHVRGSASIFERILQTYLGVVWIVGGDVTGVDAFGGGGGLEGGVTVRLPRAPVWARAGYRVERATLGDAGGGETVERLSVSIGAAFW